MMINLSI